MLGGAKCQFDDPDGKYGWTKGHVMVDTGASMTLVTDAWAKAHGLKVTPKQLAVRGANNQAVNMLGVTSFTL